MPSMMLSAVKTGITRLRVKGGASADSLYDLVNGYVTAARTIAPRPGSERFVELPQGTIGLSLFNGVFQVFSDHAITGGIPSNFNVNVLSPPADAAGGIPYLVRIWKAEPLMGGLYVVAEWSDRSDRAIHYWIEGAGSQWKPNHIYMLGEKVGTPGGLAFAAGRLNPADPPWTPETEVQVGDAFEPTIFNGYRYVVKEIFGTPARTGKKEPKWIAKTGATVIEDADLAPSGPGQQLPPSGGGGGGGYDNPGGSCVVATAFMSDGSRARDAVVGLLYATHDPGEGYAMTPLSRKGDHVMQPCVRLHTRLGASLTCSTSTPFTHVDAIHDAPEFTTMAPDMLGEKVRALHHGDRIVDTVVRIDDIGMQWVIPQDFGGRSFAAGDAPDLLIFSHNVQKNNDERMIR